MTVIEYIKQHKELLAPLEHSGSTTERHEPSNAENDLKNNFLKIIEVLNKEVKKFP